MNVQLLILRTILFLPDIKKLCKSGDANISVKKVRVYSPISRLKAYHPTFTFYPLVTGPVHSCAISTPRRAYSPAAISAH